MLFDLIGEKIVFLSFVMYDVLFLKGLVDWYGMISFIFIDLLEEE